MLSCGAPCHVEPCRATLSRAVPCHTEPCLAKPCHAVPPRPVPPAPAGPGRGSAVGHQQLCGWCRGWQQLSRDLPPAEGTWPRGCPIPCPLAWQLPRPCGSGAATGAPAPGSARGSPRAAVHQGCPPSLCRDRSPASARISGAASLRPAAEAPLVSPQQRARRRGRHRAVQPGGLPAKQRPWREPSGGEGSGRKATLVPRARPVRRKRVGGQEGRPAAGDGDGRRGGRGGAGPQGGSQPPLPLCLPGPVVVSEWQHRDVPAARGDPAIRSPVPTQVGKQQQRWSRSTRFGWGGC